jgi:hypothetical protein
MYKLQNPAESRLFSGFLGLGSAFRSYPATGAGSTTLLLPFHEVTLSWIADM